MTTTTSTSAVAIVSGSGSGKGDYTATKFFNEYCRQQKLRCPEIAARLGFSPTYVRKIKARMLKPSSSFVLKAHTTFGVPIEMFVAVPASASKKAK